MNNGETGTLFASNTEEELRVIVEYSFATGKGKGLAHIIDSKGNYIISLGNPLQLKENNYIFRISRLLEKKKAALYVKIWQCKNLGF